MNHSQVAHTWANQSARKNRAKGHSMFYEGPTIYSWGHHFAIATHVTNDDGQQAVIFTRGSYSSSTGHHKNLVWNALDYGKLLPTFYGNPAPRYGVAANDKDELFKSFRTYVEDARKAAIKAKRARLYGETYANEARELLSEAAKFNAFFKLGGTVPAFSELVTDEQFADMQKKAREAAKVRRACEEARKLQQQKNDAESFEAWKRGEGWSCPWSYQTDTNGSAFLRIKGDEVQTSRGAQVPLHHARRVFRFVKACKEQGREWHSNGAQVRIGYYHLDKVTSAGDIKAGCHVLSWERIAECAQAGGFFDDTPSAEAVETAA